MTETKKQLYWTTIALAVCGLGLAFFGCEMADDSCECGNDGECDSDPEEEGDSDNDSGSDTDDTDSEDGEAENPFDYSPSNVTIDDLPWADASEVSFTGQSCSNHAEINTSNCEVDCLEDVTCVIATQTDDTEVALILASSFVVGDDVQLDIVGKRPLVVIATSNVRIEGLIWAIDPIHNERGHAGGYSCDSTLTPLDGNGPGGGGAGWNGEGAGGGGYCGAGGAGGPDSSESDLSEDRRDGGQPYGNSAIIPLRGGSAGGKGEYGTGGAGGGAIQISAAGSITVGELGAVNMSGNGGLANQGGGGGSGGAILLEAHEILVEGILAANGGGGGSGGLYGDGMWGQTSNEPALGQRRPRR